MRGDRLHWVGGALLVAAWIAAALVARPPAGVLEARWVPDDCHVAPGASGEALARWSELRAAGVPNARLPFDANYERTHPDTVRVRASRAGDDVYLAWPIAFERVVLARMRFDGRGAPERAEATATVHGDSLLELSAHPNGLLVWATGDHGVRRVMLTRDLQVQDFRLESDAIDFGAPVQSRVVPFAERGVVVESDALGRRALLAPADPLRGIAEVRLPLGRGSHTCLVSGSELARLGPNLSFWLSPDDWRVRYGTARVIVLGASSLGVFVLMIALLVGLRRLRRLREATSHTGTVQRDEAGALTWYDDERGASPLRRVGRAIGDVQGRAVLLGRPGVPEGYRGAAVSEADVLFAGDAAAWRAWLARRRAALVRGVWGGVAAVSAISWGLLATVAF